MMLKKNTDPEELIEIFFIVIFGALIICAMLCCTIAFFPLSVIFWIIVAILFVGLWRYLYDD